MRRKFRFFVFIGDCEYNRIVLYPYAKTKNMTHHVTVDYLESAVEYKRRKHKSFGVFHEIKIILIFFAISFVGVNVFTNAQLFVSGIEDIFNPIKPISVQNIEQSAQEDNKISSIVDRHIQKEAEIEQLIQEFKVQDGNMPTSLAKDIQEVLQEQVKGYDFSFNTLPPTNRLIVPKFAVDDPIVTSQYTNMKEFIYKNYNEELKQGVVKYPTTPEPGQPGNTLIFGHTSQERWKENHYGMAFANIAKIALGDAIQIVRKGQLYEYKVVDIQVRYPQQVNEFYMQYVNKEKKYLTLMGCYPIGTSKQRILVVAEQIEGPTDEQAAQ